MYRRSHPDIVLADGTDHDGACSDPMARKQKLKVFRIPTGFHDAYVTVPSRKAALEAWGSDADLFARGIAEVVTDEELSREPPEHPGKVIKRSRGTAEEQLAALPPDTPHSLGSRGAAEDDNGNDAEEAVVRRRPPTARTGGAARATAADRDKPQATGETESKARTTASPKEKAKPKAKPKTKPRPSRAKLDQAERGLATVVERQALEKGDLRDRERVLEKQRRTMEAAHERERHTAEKAVEREREAHAERLDRWIEEYG